MTRARSVLTLSLLALVACGPDEQPVDDGAVTPPDRLTRPTPSIDDEQERSERPDLEGPDVELPPEAAPNEDAACCETAFVLPDPERTADEVSAVLIGDQEPLDVEGGVALEYSDGAWRTTSCIPPTYLGDYHYVVSIADENGDVVYESVRTNPNVSIGYTDLGEVNLWEPGESCEEIDVGVHGLIDE